MSEKTYYWQKEVKEIKNDSIVLEDNQEIIMTGEEQKIVLSEKPLETWEFIYFKCQKLAWQILDLLEWYENIVKKSDMQYILELLVSSIKGNYETALVKSMGIYDEEIVKKYWTSKLLEDITLKQLKKFL